MVGKPRASNLALPVLFCVCLDCLVYCTALHYSCDLSPSCAASNAILPMATKHPTLPLPLRPPLEHQMMHTLRPLLHLLDVGILVVCRRAAEVPVVVARVGFSVSSMVAIVLLSLSPTATRSASSPLSSHALISSPISSLNISLTSATALTSAFLTASTSHLATTFFSWSMLPRRCFPCCCGRCCCRCCGFPLAPPRVPSEL